MRPFHAALRCLFSLVVAAALVVACAADPAPDAPSASPPEPRLGVVQPGTAPRAAIRVADLSVYSNPISRAVPSYDQALALLERGVREDRREDLQAAEALLLDALEVVAAREDASLDWLLAPDLADSPGQQRRPTYRLVGHLMYLAWVRERSGDASLRDRLVQASVLDPDAYAFHFGTRAVDEVIRFEQLDACFALATTVQGGLERWRSDHGGLYPETLAELVPELIPAVPACPADGVSYEELYERIDGGRDFRLVCHAHQAVNDGPLCVGPRCGAPVNPALEQSFKIYPMLLGSFLDAGRRDLFLPLLLERAQLQPGQVVADIGAGAGMFTIPFAQAVGPGGKVYAVDINASVLAFVQARAQSHPGTQVETVLSVRPDVTLPPASVDVAFIIQTYHAMLDLDRPASPEVWRDRTGPWMRTVHQALAPGGLLIIQDGADKMDPDNVAANLATLGFELVSLERDWDRQYIAVFRRS